MLKNIDIHNYRAIKGISLENFANINIFTGAANTGKSTILEAIYFLCNIQINSLNYILKIRNFIDEKDMFTALFHDYNINNNIEISGNLNSEDLSCSVKSGNSIVYDGLNNWLSSINIEYNRFIDRYSYSATIDNNSNIHIDISYSGNIGLSAEYLATFSSYDTLKNNLSKVLLNNHSKKLLNKYLQDFDSNIDDIMFIGNIISVSYKNLSNAVNIKSMGKGFYSYLTIISSILAGSKIIIIDEIENGIHYTLLETLIRNILKISMENEVQFFISTHSKEFLEVFNNLLKNSCIDINLYNIYNKNNSINHIIYNKDNINLMLSNQNEIRD